MIITNGNPEISGTINITREVRENEIVYRFTWEGGDTIGITLELLQDAGPEIRVEHGYIRFGPFLVEPIGVVKPTTLLCKRIE